MPASGFQIALGQKYRRLRFYRRAINETLVSGPPQAGGMT
jgi:hypothetical protein